MTNYVRMYVSEIYLGIPDNFYFCTFYLNVLSLISFESNMLNVVALNDGVYLWRRSLSLSMVYAFISNILFLHLFAVFSFIIVFSYTCYHCYHYYYYVHCCCSCNFQAVSFENFFLLNIPPFAEASNMFACVVVLFGMLVFAVTICCFIISKFGCCCYSSCSSCSVANGGMDLNKKKKMNEKK